MNTANAFVAELLALADEKGWFLTGLQSQRPCSVTITDPRHGVDITIKDDFGLYLKEYMGQLAVIPQRKIDIIRPVEDDGSTQPVESVP